MIVDCYDLDELRSDLAAYGFTLEGVTESTPTRQGRYTANGPGGKEIFAVSPQKLVWRAAGAAADIARRKDQDF